MRRFAQTPFVLQQICNKPNKVSRGETECPRRWQFDGGMHMDGADTWRMLLKRRQIFFCCLGRWSSRTVGSNSNTGFLFCCNDSPKLYPLLSQGRGTDRLTDRGTDRSICLNCLMQAYSYCANVCSVFVNPAFGCHTPITVMLCYYLMLCISQVGAKQMGLSNSRIYRGLPFLSHCQRVIVNILTASLIPSIK